MSKRKTLTLEERLDSLLTEVHKIKNEIRTRDAADCRVERAKARNAARDAEIKSWRPPFEMYDEVIHVSGSQGIVVEITADWNETGPPIVQVCISSPGKGFIHGPSRAFRHTTPVTST